MAYTIIFQRCEDKLNFGLKGHTQAKITKNLWFYFGFLIWPYDVNSPWTRTAEIF